MEKKVTDFDSIMLKLASPEKILSWSHGEVTKPETINYRTQRSERNGLFDERIFGPEKDYECYCGKYRRIRYKGIICEKCGVEVTRSIVRRERMGHITLAVPVSNIWFVRNIPSRLGLLLDLSIANLEKVIYFAGYIITKVNEEEKAKLRSDLEKEYKSKVKEKAKGEEKDTLKEALTVARKELDSIKQNKVLSEVEYYNLSLKYGELLEVETGAEGLYNICKKIDLKVLREESESKLDASSASERVKNQKRLKLVRSMELASVRPEWMFLTVIPITPPALRPMVALDGGRHATSDVNDLYRRVINRNNRLKKLIDLRAPDVICRNEKRILQEAVDALIDNSARSSQKTAISQAQRRPLKSLADMLRGKQGRFRQNLLGKRVDYSGRSVIVVGPELKLHQCGLPKHMALELFRPFVISKLISRDMAFNIRGSNKLIDEKTPEVWAILEEIIKEKYVLLNRAPTLHRLGIQAFQPILIEGNAIQVHPLVCTAFNADFDGDQMAVHVPLSDKAQKEAKEIMLSSRNLLNPGDGKPVVQPSQDIVLGCFWMTQIVAGSKGEGMIFSSPNEAITAFDFGHVDLKAKIQLLGTDSPTYKAFKGKLLETSVGRLLFNSVLPTDFPFENEEMSKKKLSSITDELILKYGSDKTPEILDKIKNFGYKYATKSGISWGYEDLIIPKDKPALVKKSRDKVALIEEHFKNGLLTDNERYQKIIEIWEEVRNELDKLVPEGLDKLGPVHVMVTSKARGTWAQIAQMIGMKGQVVNPAGRIIDFPVLSSYKEGLTVLEYFISTHGARKGLADTALKTAKAGYLTRRLVDVAQDVVVNEYDCKTSKGVIIKREDAIKKNKDLSVYLDGRILLSSLKVTVDGETREFKKNHLINSEESKFIDAGNMPEVIVRSPINCEAPTGVCQLCYGRDLGRNDLVKIGATVGVVAAQAIGEPGTQLTMRTFHLGGVAGRGDITQGLPRVEEVFEMIKPKNPAILSHEDGIVSGITSEGEERTLTILVKEPKGKSGKDKNEISHIIPFGRDIIVEEGQEIKSGTPLTDGAIDIAELFSTGGQEAAQNYILSEIDTIYSSQGAAIASKHIETIISKMFSRFKVKSQGDTKFNTGEVIERSALIEENNKMKEQGKEKAEGIKQLMGIRKVALTTGSFLSSASFQDTTRILVRTALSGAEDKLVGLKENVMIGRLIPAGTGFRKKGERKPEKEYTGEDEKTEE